MMKYITKPLLATCLALILISLPAYANSSPPIEGGRVSPHYIKPIAPIQLNVAPLAAIQPISTPAPVPAPKASGSLSEWLLKLRTCESGGNYQINTGNSFYGAYQFTIETWNSMNTGYARADLAPPAVQDKAIVDNTNRASGGLATQNPGCYAKEGLSAFPPS